MAIQAAGAVLWRRRRGRLEVAVVHRPRYDDWTLPKGKLHDGEDALAAAQREVLEETGYRGCAGPEIARTSYEVGGAQPSPKTVRFWSMEAVGGEFDSNEEVDALRWLPAAEAGAALTHQSERAVLEGFLARAAIAAGGS